jgi:glycosyltransferase involved in cell wall biosynthesis
VIASAVGGTSEVVRDGENGFLVPAGEPAVLAERLIGLLERPEEAARLGRAGRVFAEQFFSPERYLAGYRALTDMAARAAGLEPVAG